MMKKIIAVDFDGTLVKNDYPEISNPNLRLIRFIMRNRDKYIFILWTCRHDKDLEEAIDYLWFNFRLKFDYVNENVPELIQKFGDTRKIYAEYYIDDKNIINNFYEKI